MFVRRSLQLARQLKDRAVEAQACYSLGNTYTLLQDYERAIDYHLKHLIIAQDLNDRCTHTRTPIQDRNRNPFLYFLSFKYALYMDLNAFCCRIGEGRACWSLGNAYTALGNHDQAMHFAEKHLEICKEVHECFKFYQNKWIYHAVVKLTLPLFFFFGLFVCFSRLVTGVGSWRLVWTCLISRWFWVWATAQITPPYQKIRI